MRNRRLQHSGPLTNMNEGAGGDGFDSVIAGDLASRREALDALDEFDFVSERAGILTLYADGRVVASVILAAADGPKPHPRLISDDTVARLAEVQPPRWWRARCIDSGQIAGEPAAILLKSWKTSDAEHYEKEVEWSALLLTVTESR